MKSEIVEPGDADVLSQTGKTILTAGYPSGMRVLKRRVKPLPLAVMALAVALLSALGGCNSVGGPATDGPLSSGVDGRIPRGQVCVPGGGPQTFGLERFTNHGRSAVVLDRVVLLRPHHERLIGSYAVPGTFLIGVPGDWPPKYAGLPPTWKYRQAVQGFRLGSGKSFNMVLGVIATSADRANSRGMVIYYHDSAGSYVTTDEVAMTIAATKRGCD